MRPPPVEAGGGLRDRALEGRIALPLVLVTRLHGALLLREQRDRRGELGEAAPRAAHHPQHLERGDDAVARRRVLEHDDVAALLAAEPRARDLHALEDVLVADGRPHDLAAGRLDGLLQAAVREHRHHERATGQRARATSRSSARMPSTWSPSTICPARIDRDQPVGVAVEREADVGAALRRPHAPARPGRSRRSWTLMLTPSGSAWMTSTVGPGRRAGSGADRAARAVRAVEDDAQAAAGIDRRRGPAGAGGSARCRPRASTIRPSSALPTPPSSSVAPDQLLELVLDRVVELEAVAVEHLEPVVVGRVVRGRDHDPGRERARCRRGTPGPASGRPRRVDVRAEARRAGRDRGHEHVAGAPRVLADDERAARPDEAMRRRAARARTPVVGLRSTLATPRIPSVPKRRAIASAARRRGGSDVGRG